MTDRPKTLAHTDAKAARMERMRKAAEEIAAALRANKDMHQEHAALNAGVARSTYWRWLDGESEAELMFQSIVLPAVHDQAAAVEQDAEKAIGCCENGSGAWGNWFKWKMSQKFRRIYGDLEPKRVEVTGKDGRDLIPQMSDAEIEAKLAAIAAGVASGARGAEESEEDA